MVRRMFAAVTVLTVFLFAGSAFASQSTTSASTADTVIQIGEVSIGGQTVSLGYARAFASTDPGQLANPHGGGQPYAAAEVWVAGERHGVDSRSNQESQDIPAVEIPGVGSAGVEGMGASAGDADATSFIRGVDVSTVLDHVAAVDVQNTGARTVGDQSTATNGVEINGVSVKIGDVLGDVVAELPLSALLAIVDGVLDEELPIGGTAREHLQTVLAFRDAADEIVQAEEAVADLRAERDGLLDSRPTAVDAVTSADSQLATAQADVETKAAAVESTKAEIESQKESLLANNCNLLGITQTCQDIQATINTLEQETLPAQQAALEAAQATAAAAAGARDAAVAELGKIDAAVADVEAQVRDVVGDVDDLIDTVLGLADMVAALDFEGLITALVDGINGIELVTFDKMTVGVGTVTDANRSEAVAVCEMVGASAAGAAPVSGSCADVEGVFAAVEGVLTDLLGSLPIELPSTLPDVASLVTVQAPTGVTTPAGFEKDGNKVAQAKVSPLVVKVAGVELEPVVDELLGTVTGLVDGALETVAGAAGIEIPAEATALLGKVTATIEGLGLGDVIGSLSIPEVDLSLGGLVANSQSGEKVSDSGDSPSPVGGPTPDTTPGAPTPAGNLPTTGGGIGILTLVMLGVGGAATWMSRPSRVG